MSKLNYFLGQKNNADIIFDHAIAYINKYFEVHFNEISLNFEIKAKNDLKWYELNINSLFIRLRKGGINISIKSLEILLKSDLINKSNPIKEYFFNLEKWDNKDHIAYLSSFVKTSDDIAFTYHLKKWMVRTVKCALEDGYFNKQCFVLVHNRQDSGKSTWCRFITPPSLKDYTTENISIDKDSKIQLTKNFIINLDELAVLGKRDINALKSYFSITSINERLPYDRKNSKLNRICSFIGSTNETDFLDDPTGSVRWLCFELTDAIDFNYSKEVEINKVWSQAYYLAYKDAGFNPELTIQDRKENEERNKQFRKLTMEEELLIKYYEKSESIEDFKTATDIHIQLETMNLHTKPESIGKALKSLNYNRIKHSKKQIYGYLAVFKKENT